MNAYPFRAFDDVQYQGIEMSEMKPTFENIFAIWTGVAFGGYPST